MLTVSPNYSKEIQTPQGGFNLQEMRVSLGWPTGLLRLAGSCWQDFVSAKAASLRLAGILNGIDDCTELRVRHFFVVFFFLWEFSLRLGSSS